MKLLKILAAAFGLAAASSVMAQGGDAIKIIVPFSAGGPTDQIARIVAAPLSTLLGKPVIVDNRGGAGGVVGVAAAAKNLSVNSKLRPRAAFHAASGRRHDGRQTSRLLGGDR